MKRSEQRDWDSRLPSTLHAVAITLASVYALGIADTFDSNRLAKVRTPNSSTPLFELTQTLALSYPEIRHCYAQTLSTGRKQDADLPKCVVALSLIRPWGTSVWQWRYLVVHDAVSELAHLGLQTGDSVMLANSQFTEAAIGMSLGYFLCDVVVIARNWAEVRIHLGIHFQSSQIWDQSFYVES